MHFNNRIRLSEKYSKALLLCAAVFLMASCSLTPESAPKEARWEQAAPMHMARKFLNLVVLPDGRVMATSHEENASNSLAASSEIYDPKSNAWSQPAPIPASAWTNSSAFVVGNPGVVVLTSNTNHTLCNLETFQWSKGFYISVLDGYKEYGYPSHAAKITALDQDRLLYSGGFSTSDTDALIFDVTNRSIEKVAYLHGGRQDHIAVRLQDGRVLVAGGLRHTRNYLDSAEIYDPRLNDWQVVPSMHVQRGNHPKATLMKDGRVMVLGGIQSADAKYLASDFPDLPEKMRTCAKMVSAMRTAEIFDPKANAWKWAAPMACDGEQRGTPRHLLTLNDGRILLISNDGETQIYTPVKDAWQDGPTMEVKRYAFSAAVVLPDGRVMVAGGVRDSAKGEVLSAVEIFTP